MREGMIPRRLAGVGTLGLVVGLLLLVSGVLPAGATHVAPIEVAGNPSCGSLGEWDEVLRIDPVASGTYTGTGGEIITITVTDTEQGQVFDFTSSDPINGVFVKGGNSGNLYDYGDAGTVSDTGLHAPANASGNWAGLSHISFCRLKPSATTSSSTTTTEADTTATTEAEDTTTTTEAEDTTTTTVEVLPEVVTTTTTVVAVKPAQLTTTTVAAVAETLPFTGSGSGSLAGLGAALMTMGGLMLATVRLRKRWAE